MKESEESLARQARMALWLRLFESLPPAARPFLPPIDEGRKPTLTAREYDHCQMLFSAIDVADLVLMVMSLGQWGSYPLKPTWGIPGRSDDAPPSWDNVVRAYEEDR